MSITEKIQQLKKSEIKQIIDARIKEFEQVRGTEDSIFSELCFCILTANSTAENCIRVQKEAGKFFFLLDSIGLADKLKQVGCRFHTKRAGYICEARGFKDELISQIKTSDEREIRNWVADTIKGLGMKESSHFLRNIGFKNVAIIDFHILDLLEKEKILEKPKKLDKKTYLEIEQVLEKLARKLDLNLAELDLYLWYIETGKILK